MSISIFVNTFFFVLFYFLIIFSIVGYGLIFVNFLRLNNEKNISLGIIGFLGFFFLTFISYFTSFFLSHNYYHNTTIHFVGIFFLILNLLKKKLELKIFKRFFFILFFSLIGIFISKNHEDFPYYHLPFIVNLVENKLQVGLGELNYNFKTSSSLFYLKSLFYLPYVDYYLVASSGVMFLSFFNFFFFDKLFFQKIKKYNYIHIITLLSFIFLNLVFWRLSAYGTDRAPQILSFLLIILIFSLINEKEINIKNIKIILILLLYLISIKAYFITYTLFSVFLFYILIKKKKLHILFLEKIFFLIYFTFIFFFLLSNFFISGCLFFPLELSCFYNYSWSTDEGSMRYYNQWFELWSKSGASPNYRVSNPEQYISNINWVYNWVNNYFLDKGKDTLLAILAIKLIIFFYFFKKNLNINSIKINKLHKFIYFIIIFLFLIWFFKHPDLRYGGYILFSLIFFIPFSFYLSKFFNEKTFSNDKKKIIILVVFVIMSFNLRNINRIYKEFGFENFYSYNNFPFFYIKETKFTTFIFDKNLKLNILSNDEIHCWATPSPCTRSQLILKKFYNYTFITSRKTF